MKVKTALMMVITIIALAFPLSLVASSNGVTLKYENPKPGDGTGDFVYLVNNNNRTVQVDYQVIVKFKNRQWTESKSVPANDKQYIGRTHAEGGASVGAEWYEYKILKVK